MEERVTLTEVKFHHELQALVTIGTKFTVRATPLDHDFRPLVFAFITNNNECALDISLQHPLKEGRRVRLLLASTNAAAESTPISKKVSTLDAGKEIILSVLVKEHSFEISLGTQPIGSFVHRVHPSLISKILLDGPATEVVVIPAMAALPAYSEIFGVPTTQRAHTDRRDDGGKLFRTLYYMRHSRYSRMLKRRQSTFL